jgi:hypothetical protein
MGNCSSTSKCNPCGPNYDAINLLATKTASYARQANTSAVNAENSFLGFNALYLGAFASAPTVDNEGNPLQEGALYFNSVSNKMFVWQGASWIFLGFDEFTPFTATGTPTARNLVNRTADVINVKDFGAVGDGVADDRAAFQNAIATGKTVFIPDGTYNLTTGVGISSGTLNLIGSSKDKVKLISNVGTWMFLCNVSGIQFENITFDGRRVREINGWPWFDPQPYDGTFRIIQAQSPQGLDNSFISIDKCEFLNTASLPIFFYYFNNVKITNSRFYKTGDPGLVFCNKVFWSNNITEYSLDNGVSMSRGNDNAIIESSIFKDCRANGVWVSGYVIPGTGTVTATGASFNVLDQVTLTSSTNQFQSGFINNYLTQKSGALEATYKIISVTSSSVAIGVCVNSIDPAFQATAISDWEFSPSYGPNNFIVSNNIIIGGYYGGISAQQSNNNGQISNNVILRSGWQADSEIKTIGSIASGSTTLNVNSSSNFSIGDYIIINPANSYREYFITKITNIAGNIITTETSPTITYISENIQLVHTESTITTARNDIFISGSNSGVPDEVSNQISISNNIMSDSAGGCILLVGSLVQDGGSVKNIKINNNSMYYSLNSAGLFPLNLRHGVFINEENPLAQPCENIIVTDNFYTGYGRILNYRQNSLAIRNYIVCANNTYPNGSDFSAIDIATSTVLTDNYRTSHYDQYGTLIADAITTKTLQFPSWQVANVVAGVMNVIQSTIAFFGTNPTTQITDFTKGVNSDLLVFSLRNSNTFAGSTITIVHNTSKIRTQSGSDIVLVPGAAALFAFVNNTTVIQIG